MDMMKGSTSFRALRDKYKDFSAPSVEITVGIGKAFGEKGGYPGDRGGTDQRF